MVTTSLGYSRLAISFHWLSFLLVAVAYVAIEMRGPHNSQNHAFWMSMHVWGGTMLLLLSILRLGWRLWQGAPSPLPSPRLQIVCSQAVHIALYAFVILQPLLGMLSYNLGGKPVTLTGLNWSFSLVGPDPNLRHAVKEIHELLGNVFYGVIGVHAAVALFHHLVRRDNTLRRMSLG